MKRRGARERGEGWLIAAALCLVAALALASWLNRRPRAELAAPVHFVSMEALKRAEQVNINAADTEELEALPGVGPALAARIAAWREENGPFESVEALDEVPGIGEGKLAALREHAWAGPEEER